MSRGRTRLLAFLAILGVTATASGRQVLPLPEGERWTQPVPSPDGRFLAVTREGYRGVFVLELDTGELREIESREGSGYRFAWAPDSSVLAYRQRLGRSVEIVVARPDGTKEVATPLLPSLAPPVFRGDGTLVVGRFENGRPAPIRRRPASDRRRTIAPRPHPFAAPDGRLVIEADPGRFVPVRAVDTRAADARVFYNPVVSPDGDVFVVECLDGQLYRGRLDREDVPLERLTAGSYPSFVDGGRTLLFERTADDGHRLTAADVWRLDLATGEATPLFADPDLVERRPASDGRRVYYEVDGTIAVEPLP